MIYDRDRDLPAGQAVVSAVPSRSVLVVEDEAQQVEVLSRLLGRSGWSVHAAASGAAALAAYRAQQPAVVLLDLGLPDMNGLEVLQLLRETDPEAVVVVLTGDGSIELAVEAMQGGAENFLLKPYAFPHLAAALERAREKVVLRRQSRRLWEQQLAQHGFAGAGCVASQDLVRQVQTLALSDETVLLIGETGTGKSRVAPLLHSLSARTRAPYLAANCAGVTATFLEAELFGHERVAISEAQVPNAGIFETAHRGSVLLDEIGDLASELQPKLLATIDDRRFRRIGGTREMEFDVRVIGATHRDLRADVRAGRFQEDLFQRIATASLRLPPLRERGRDAIAALATAFLAELAHRFHKRAVHLTPQAVDVLAQHAWPGNIRELKNVLEQALLVIGDNDEIQPRHLPGELRRRRQQPRARADVDLTLAQLERRHVDRVLRRTGGNRTQAARMLGISRVGLYKKLQRYEEESAGQRAPAPTATSGGAPAPHDDPRHDERANRWNQRGEAE